MIGKKKIALAGVAAVILIIAIAMIVTRPPKLHLEEFITDNPIFVGYDKHAVLETEDIFDEDAFRDKLMEYGINEEKLLNSVDYDNASEEELEATMNNNFNTLSAIEDALMAMEDSITLTLYKNGEAIDELKNLGNGDEIEIEVSSSAESNEYFDVKLVEGRKQFTIGELEEGKAFDVFAHKDFQVECFGASGSGTIQVIANIKDVLPVNVDFVIENNGELKNGDKVTISMEYDALDLFESGYYFEEDELEYEVTQLGKYITATEDFPKGYIKEFQSTAEEKLNDRINLFMFTDRIDVHSIYLGVLKDGVSVEDSTAKNEVVVLGKYKSSGETKYCQVTLSDAIVYPDGEVLFDGMNLDIQSFYIFDQYGFQLSDFEEAINSSGSYDYVKL